VRSERSPDSLRPRPDLHADLYQRQPAEVEVGCFMDAGRIEPPPTDGDLSPGEVRGDRAAVHSEHNSTSVAPSRYCATRSSICSGRSRV
jgi:hypothetical protein